MQINKAFLIAILFNLIIGVSFTVLARGAAVRHFEPGQYILQSGTEQNCGPREEVTIQVENNFINLNDMHGGFHTADFEAADPNTLPGFCDPGSEITTYRTHEYADRSVLTVETALVCGTDPNLETKTHQIKTLIVKKGLLEMRWEDKTFKGEPYSCIWKKID